MMKPLPRLAAMMLFVAAIPLLASQPQAQEEDAVDVMGLLAGLAGHWQGTLVLEAAQGEPLVVPFHMAGRVLDEGKILIEEHRFDFPQGPVEAVDVSRYESARQVIETAYFTGGRRFVLDLEVTEVEADEAPKRWRLMTEHDGEEEGKPVRVRNLFQMEDGLFSKWRWVAPLSNDKPGPYSLSDTVVLERQAGGKTDSPP
ncbi:MAG: hypothetical protein ACOY99_04450 [Pseudomonadota bacterium]